MYARRSFAWSVGATVLTLILLPDTAQPQDRSAEPGPPTVGSGVGVADGRLVRVSPLDVGSTVRVRAPTLGEGWIEGVVDQVGERSLTIRTNREPLSVPRDAITRLEVSTGRHRQVWKGLAIGAGVGAAVGGASGCVPMIGCGGDADQHLAGALLGAVGFAGWGAIIGVFVQTERWQAVRLERVHVTLAPARGGGFGLRVTCSF